MSPITIRIAIPSILALEIVLGGADPRPIAARVVQAERPVLRRVA